MKKITKEELSKYNKPSIFEKNRNLYLYINYKIINLTEYLEKDRDINEIWVYEKEELIKLRNLINKILKENIIECKITKEGNLRIIGDKLPLYIKEEVIKNNSIIKGLNIILKDSKYKAIGIIKGEIIIGEVDKYYSYPYNNYIVSNILSSEGCEFIKYKGEE